MKQEGSPGSPLSPEAQAYYAAEVELDRLSLGTGQLEFVASRDSLAVLARSACSHL